MAKKSLGQNFLFDPTILRRIVNVSGVTSGDAVVEIGPGHGTLTRPLSGAARKVIAIELDEGLYERLKREPDLPSNVELVLSDALEFPYESLERFKVVANIPYYITTPFIFRLIEARGHVQSMTLTVQREVAERIIARPGRKAYGALSIAVQYYADAKLEFIIPRGAFRPVPKVDSAVVRIDMLERPRIAVRDEKLFFRIVRAAFSQRRKTLANALKPVLPPQILSETGGVKGLLIRAGIDPARRGETLSIEEFAKLADAVKEEARFGD